MPNTDDSAALCAAYVSNQWISYFRKLSQTFELPGRFDSDDCVQECCVELIELINEIDPTDPDFDSVLKSRIYKRLVDLHRHETCSKRDHRRSVSLPDEETAELTDSDDPFATVSVHDLQDQISEDLTPQHRLVWRELVHPGRSLRKVMSDYCRKRGRAIYNVPVSVYAEVTGLSIRQVRYALDRIRAVTRRFLMEGVLVTC